MTNKEKMLNGEYYISLDEDAVMRELRAMRDLRG